MSLSKDCSLSSPCTISPTFVPIPATAEPAYENLAKPVERLAAPISPTNEDLGLSVNAFLSNPNPQKNTTKPNPLLSLLESLAEHSPVFANPTPLAKLLQQYPEPTGRSRSYSMSEIPSTTSSTYNIAIGGLNGTELPLQPLDGEEDSDDDVEVPAMMSRFSAIYNKHGRIGIYTKDERTEILTRFLKKRTSRCWRKKIRYGCRKNLADRRMRVKGRFVKREEDVVLSGGLLDNLKGVKAATSAEVAAEPVSDVSEPVSDEERDEQERNERKAETELPTAKRMRRHSVAF